MIIVGDLTIQFKVYYPVSSAQLMPFTKKYVASIKCPYEHCVLEKYFANDYCQPFSNFLVIRIVILQIFFHVKIK